jgi:hypothetical protein
VTSLRTPFALFCAAALVACDCGGAGPPDGGVDGGADAGCPPVFSGTMVRLSEGLLGAKRIASDRTHLYLSEAAALSPGRLSRVPVWGGGIEVLMPNASNPGLESADAIAVDATHVFVVDDSGVWRVNKTTRVAVLIDQTVTNAALGATDLKTTGDGAGDRLLLATGLVRLMAMDKDGANAVELYKGDPGDAVTSVAVEGDRAYFLVASSSSASEGLYTVNLTAPNIVQRLSAEPNDARALTITPGEFLWAEGNAEGGGRVRSLDRATNLVSDRLVGLWAPSRIIPVADELYVADRTDDVSTPSFLRRGSACDGLSPVAVGPAGQGPGDVLFEETFLYFTSVGSGTEGFVGRLSRAR